MSLFELFTQGDAVTKAVAGLLLAGTALVFVGLMVVVPVLGHATWHLYRKLIA